MALEAVGFPESILRPSRSHAKVQQLQRLAEPGLHFHFHFHFHFHLDLLHFLWIEA